MSDLESAELRQRLKGQTHDGSGKAQDGQTSLTPPLLPYNHPINILWRVTVMSGALWGLHSMSVFVEVTRGTAVKHGWFKFGLAASVAIQAIKGYMELYEGRMKKRKIEYKNYKNATHVTILLILFASVSFHVALWPTYGVKTFLIMFMFGYGLLLQFMLLLPTWIQNPVTIVAMTFFIQQYQ